MDPSQMGQQAAQTAARLSDQATRGASAMGSAAAGQWDALMKLGSSGAELFLSEGEGLFKVGCEWGEALFGQLASKLKQQGWLSKMGPAQLQFASLQQMGQAMGNAIGGSAMHSDLGFGGLMNHKTASCAWGK